MLSGVEGGGVTKLALATADQLRCIAILQASSRTSEVTVKDYILANFERTELAELTREEAYCVIDWLDTIGKAA